MMSSQSQELPYTLSIAQTAQYYGTGEKSLRRFVKEHMEDKYILRVGSIVRIKRNIFEKHLYENITVI